MIKHIVMWKLKDFAEGMSKSENAKKMKDLLLSLKEKIDAINSMEVGINVNDNGENWDIVLYSEFENLDNLNIYMNHPEHKNVKEFISKVRLKRVAVDYEV
jgi:hypothetical protein|tara:strand:+ start:46204 stop:46506 length:303 start_codon:yes stop_codon:yes gene_type:complete